MLEKLTVQEFDDDKADSARTDLIFQINFGKKAKKSS